MLTTSESIAIGASYKCASCGEPFVIREATKNTHHIEGVGFFCNPFCAQDAFLANSEFHELRQWRR